MSSTDRPDARIDVAAGLRFHAVVPAAGRGERFGAAKQFVPVAGRPLLAWTVRRLREAGAASITLVLPADDLGDARRRLAADPEVICVAGGETRQASVALGVAASPAASADLVAVHDGARAAVAVEDLVATVAAAQRSGGAILGRPVTDTIKEVAAGLVVRTVDRSRLLRAETPQVFRRSTLEAALATARRDCFVGTDEASLVERLGGVEIVAVAARWPNPKVTLVEDLETVARLLAAEGGEAVRLRIGQGYDVHRLVPGRRLMLGGLEIPFDRGLDGHSDADVLLHALCDAILGAAGLGDIGRLFPPGDPQWKDASGLRLLGIVAEAARQRGWRVVNCDLTLIAEAPRLAPHAPEIRGRIAGILGVGSEEVGLKATTHEGLGALGRGEGMAALAVVLLAGADE